MNKKPKRANRHEIARLVSQQTGYTIESIEEILEAEDYVIEELIAQGIPIKHHKLYKIEIQTMKPKKAWNGIAKEYYELPERQNIKFVPMINLTKAIDRLNKREKD